MDEYLKKEVLIEDFKSCGANKDIVDAIIYRINQHQPADVVEVRSGEWIKKEDGHYVCSECGRTRPYSNYANAIDNWVCNYCYYCGAIMDGGKKQ